MEKETGKERQSTKPCYGKSCHLGNCSLYQLRTQSGSVITSNEKQIGVLLHQRLSMRIWSLLLGRGRAIWDTEQGDEELWKPEKIDQFKKKKISSVVLWKLGEPKGTDM